MDCQEFLMSDSFYPNLVGKGNQSHSNGVPGLTIFLDIFGVNTYDMKYDKETHFLLIWLDLTPFDGI